MTQRLTQWRDAIYKWAAQVFRPRVPTFNDEDLSRIVTADAGIHPDEVVLDAWEKLAARGVIVEFVDRQAAMNESVSDDLVTVATFRNYVKAQLAQTRLLTSGMHVFLFDDNTIRMNGLWSTALGFVKLRVPSTDAPEALAMLRLEPPIQVS
jgi:hypothetical protein